jgi:hypothetical protein
MIITLNSDCELSSDVASLISGQAGVDSGLVRLKIGESVEKRKLSLVTLFQAFDHCVARGVVSPSNLFLFL